MSTYVISNTGFALGRTDLEVSVMARLLRGKKHSQRRLRRNTLRPYRRRG